MMRSKRLAGTAVLLIGLSLGVASCADDGGYAAYGAYPYYGFYGGDFDHRHDFRFHEHGRFHHGGYGHDRGGFPHHGFHGGFRGIGLTVVGPSASCWQYQWVETRRGLRRILVDACAYPY